MPADLDYPCMYGLYTIMLNHSPVSQLDVWFTKLASLEKRKEQLDRAITTGSAEDNPNDCKMRKVNLSSLPGGLMYSLEIRMNHNTLQKSHQIALLKLYVNEINEFTLPM